jgi:hypothetical protein
MKKSILTLLSIPLFLIACNNNSEIETKEKKESSVKAEEIKEIPKVNICYRHFNDKNQVVSEVLLIDDKFINVKSSVFDDGTFQAEVEMGKKGESGKYFLGEPITDDYKEERRKINGDIVDTWGNMPMIFDSESAILNFMDKLGYTADSQEKYKYGTNYTFKRK